MNKSLFAVFSLIIFLGGCTNTTTKVDTDPIVVLAASSLTETFEVISNEFEIATGKEVILSFGASSTLAQQISNGAPADVIATASIDSLIPIADQIQDTQIFATNRVVIAFNADDSDRFTQSIFLNDSNIKWVQCDVQVPCGAVAQAALRDEQITTDPVSFEPNVSAAVARLLAREVDAAIIYQTDVLANSELRALYFKNQEFTITQYPLAQLKTSNPASKQFIDFIFSEQGSKILKDAGFIPTQ